METNSEDNIQLIEPQNSKAKPCFCGKIPELVEDDGRFYCRCESLRGKIGSHEIFSEYSKTEEGAIERWNELMDIIEAKKKKDFWNFNGKQTYATRNKIS